MECEFQEWVAPGCALFQEMAEARRRLRTIEEKHERLVKEGDPQIHSAGLEYSYAVHAYYNAVMVWLAWLDSSARARERGNKLPLPD